MKTRQTVMDAVAGVSENQARWTPAPGRWSILGYLEHLAVSDDALVALVKKSLPTPAEPETVAERAAREAKLKDTHAPRGANQAPGRFRTVKEALDAFLAANRFRYGHDRTETTCMPTGALTVAHASSLLIGGQTIVISGHGDH